MAMRAKVTPNGPVAVRPSAMKRNEAPQTRPGTASSAQSEVEAGFMGVTMAETSI